MNEKTKTILAIIIGLSLMSLYSFFVSFSATPVEVPEEEIKSETKVSQPVLSEHFRIINLCTPRFTYDFKGNIDPYFPKIVETAISEWEEALNNPNLFTYEKGSENLIGYKSYTDEKYGEAYTTYGIYSYEDNPSCRTKIVKKFEINLNSQHRELFRKDMDKLYSTLLHELGHVLGLEHSTNPNSIMITKSDTFSIKLHAEDIENAKLIQEKCIQVLKSCQ